MSTFLVAFPKGLDRDSATSAMSVISSFSTRLQPCIGSRETFAFIVESDDEAAIREVLGSSRKNFGVYTVDDDSRLRRDSNSFIERGRGVICAGFARMKGEVAAKRARSYVATNDTSSAAMPYV